MKFLNHDALAIRKVSAVEAKGGGGGGVLASALNVQLNNLAMHGLFFGGHFFLGPTNLRKPLGAHLIILGK